jgi:predicted glutamine amidotransferase
LSLNECARHGGETGPHVDGWGIAFYEGRDANLIRESSAAADSVLMSTLRGYRVASETVLAHIRRASFGPVELRNTHPFRRELRGWVHCFAHNGDLPGLEQQFELEPDAVAVPVGNTDSEYAFCLLMQRMSQLWKIPGEIPALSSRKQVVAEFAGEMGKLARPIFSTRMVMHCSCTVICGLSPTAACAHRACTPFQLAATTVSGALS